MSLAVEPGTQRVIACVLRRGGRYLVCQRPDGKRHGGLWEFPGGETKPAESDEQAAKRELQEELGIEVLSAEPAVFEIRDQGSHFVIAFVPTEAAGEPSCREHQQLKWASTSELEVLPLAPSDRAFV